MSERKAKIVKIDDPAGWVTPPPGTKRPLDEPQPYSTWRHVKTGGLYVVLGVARCSTNGEREGVERSVVYVSTTHGHLCYRELSEFLSGRFEAVSGPASQTELWHFGGIPFRPLCGANLPNQSTTSVRENVTCPACRAKMEDKP